MGSDISDTTASADQFGVEDIVLFRTIVESLPIMVFICQGERIRWVNAAGQSTTGYSGAELSAMPFSAVVHEDFRGMVEERHRARLDGGDAPESYEAKIVRKDGESRWVNFHASMIELDGKPAVLAMAEDITERKQADEAVWKLTQAIEQANKSIMITNWDGIIEYVNSAFESGTGYAAEEVLGRPARSLQGSNREAAFQDAGFYRHIWQTISSGHVWQGRLATRKRDGSFYPTRTTISPVYDLPGQSTPPSHFVCIQSDLRELEDMERRFRQAQKMEALGTLVGGIAHDFNNVLAGIAGNLFLAKEMQENPTVLQKLENIEQLSRRAAGMVKQLLTFARKDTVAMTPLSFSSLVEETLRFLRSVVPENIGIKQDVCSDALSIHGDATQLHQVLMNLVTNARDAVEGTQEPLIAVRLEPVQADDQFVRKHAYSKVGWYAHLSVEDNGCGIPETQIEHLFEPFFTTKKDGTGTGLGLAMVFGSIETHQGFVEVENNQGAGATFHVFIPLLDQAEVEPPAPQEEQVTSGHGELILLADDDRHVREATSYVLEIMGYQVLLAEDGSAAIEQFRAHRDEIALAMLDVVMPGCSGMELAQRIREVQPDVPVLFVTGYDKNEMLSGNECIHKSDTLAKPVSFDTLAHVIKKLLNS